MTPEVLTTIGVGVALAAIIFAQARNTDRLSNDRFQTLEASMNERFQLVEAHLQSLDSQILKLTERMAHLEGLLEGLREAILGRRAA